MHESSSPYVSVIIPSYNQPHTIDRCLDSVLAQETTHTYEVIIVDSSEPKKKEEVKNICKRDERIRLISLEEQTYPGTARNIGIKAAEGKIMALIDSDCRADLYWLDNIVKHMDENLVVSGVIQNGTPKSIFGTCSYLIEFNHFFPFQTESKSSPIAATCNFAAYKSVFEKVGYFTDHRAFEDMLFCKRFIEIGGRVSLFKDVRIAHLNRTDLNHVVSNQRLLGRYSASTRKEYSMSPQLIFKYPLLAYLLLPYRYFSILSRMSSIKVLIQYLLYTPILFYVLVFWCNGFYEGSRD